MGVPAEIRAVPRPKNTVVLPSTTGRYSVRARDGCRYEVDENGKKRRIPVEGSIVGHIVNGIYIAVEDEIPPAGQEGEVDILAEVVVEVKGVECLHSQHPGHVLCKVSVAHSQFP